MSVQRKVGSGLNTARLASTPRAPSHLFPHRRSYRKLSSRERESFSAVRGEPGFLPERMMTARDSGGSLPRLLRGPSVRNRVIGLAAQDGVYVDADRAVQLPELLRAVLSKSTGTVGDSARALVPPSRRSYGS